MNLRPPGYEPGELPDCSTPRRRPKYSAACAVSSIRRVTTGIWVGLAVFLVAIVAGMIWVGYQVVRSWRHLKGLTRLLDELGKLNRNVADLQMRVASVEVRMADLQHQVDGLSVTLARGRVLAGAAREVRETFDSVRSYLPTK